MRWSNVSPCRKTNGRPDAPRSPCGRPARSAQRTREASVVARWGVDVFMPGRVLGASRPFATVLARRVISIRAGRERARESGARGDLELAIGGAEVHLHGPHGDEQRLRDLGVREALGGERGDATLARRQRLHARARDAPRTGAGGAQLGARVLGERARTARGGQLQALEQRLARARALARAPERATVIDERAGQVERRARSAQAVDGRDLRLRAGHEPAHAQRPAKLAR